MERRAKGVSAKLKVTLLADAEKSPGLTGRDNTGHDPDSPRKAAVRKPPRHKPKQESVQRRRKHEGSGLPTNGRSIPCQGRKPLEVAADPARLLTKRRRVGVERVSFITGPLFTTPIADLGFKARLD